MTGMNKANQHQNVRRRGKYADYRTQDTSTKHTAQRLANYIAEHPWDADAIKRLRAMNSTVLARAGVKPPEAAAQSPKERRAAQGITLTALRKERRAAQRKEKS